jgi:hypothetical protein
MIAAHLLETFLASRTLESFNLHCRAKKPNSDKQSWGTASTPGFCTRNLVTDLQAKEHCVHVLCISSPLNTHLNNKVTVYTPAGSPLPASTLGSILLRSPFKSSPGVSQTRLQRPLVLSCNVAEQPYYSTHHEILGRSALGRHKHVQSAPASHPEVSFIH